MNEDELKQKQYELSVMAGMNQRYHQQQAEVFGVRDRWLRIAVGILAVGGSMLAVATMAPTGAWLIPTSVIVATVAAFAAVGLNVIPIADWERRHIDLFRRWSDFREEIDSLRFASRVADDGASRIASLDAKSHRLCALEPSANEKLLRACFDKEQKSRRYETTRIAEAETTVNMPSDAVSTA